MNKDQLEDHWHGNKEIKRLKGAGAIVCFRCVVPVNLRVDATLVIAICCNSKL